MVACWLQSCVNPAALFTHLHSEVFDLLDYRWGQMKFETFNTTVPACVKITAFSEVQNFNGEKVKASQTMYYERGKGQIYKSANGPIPFTKILSEYAGKK